MSESDTVVLLSNVDPARPRCSASLFLCPLLFLIGCAGVLIAILLGFFATVQEGVPLRILSLNTWGINAVFGAKDKEFRMEHIGQMVSNMEYDIYLFQELWMRPDHDTIAKHLPKGYYMTAYDDLAQRPCPWWPFSPFWCCDGDDLPAGCSGLAVVSRFPFLEIEFTMFDVHGPTGDGEKLARKGFGRVRIEPVENITVDVFVTHTCASDEVENKKARQAQVKQLMKAVRTASADFVLLGGDFNSDPRATNETTYSILKQDMASSMEDFFKIITDWLIPKRATYANPRNTYSGANGSIYPPGNSSKYPPVLYDYIWHKSSPGNLVLTNFFDIPFLTTDSIHFEPNRSKRDQSAAENLEMAADAFLSLSDHEAVSASLILYKQKQ
ncbi:uncharacterized protein LOC111700390 [Eurytemora carolleeae]|uniref:uncharacterized protein LOC111700390 n=1 Tax=Eurytemora carolleeae TaxID=1294199 RepID=UPI000C7840A9|nr:uncharacterized protein LOC111700390 [Eurytemora carolleeae]|eukprot:XP_023327042.1 uncharacterized protein LOC111700390 [Eurytemora affinis]